VLADAGSIPAVSTTFKESSPCFQGLFSFLSHQKAQDYAYATRSHERASRRG